MTRNITEWTKLRRQLCTTKKAAYTEGTIRNLKTQWCSFISFCLYFKLCYLPTSVDTLCMYAQYLSKTFKSADSIVNYLGGVRLMHLYAGLPFDLLQNFLVKLLLKGLRKRLCHTPRRALPITPQILLSFLPYLHLDSPFDITLWCSFLFAFFLMARKSNICPPSKRKFDSTKHLCRGDILYNDTGLLVLFRWSKTNQHRQRPKLTPLIKMPDSPLCPLTIFTTMNTMIPANPKDPAFLIPTNCGKFTTLTHDVFVKHLRKLLVKTGHNPSSYSGHSFRRGGATWAVRSGVSDSLIRLHGDWRSDSYLMYIHESVTSQAQVSIKMSYNVK
jgi:integrase